jgi:hypothetical protein
MAFDSQTKDAAVRLDQSLRREPWYSNVGIGSESGEPVLIIYTRYRTADDKVPSSWEGIPVRLRYVGRWMPA